MRKMTAEIQMREATSRSRIIKSIQADGHGQRKQTTPSWETLFRAENGSNYDPTLMLLNHPHHGNGPRTCHNGQAWTVTYGQIIFTLPLFFAQHQPDIRCTCIIAELAMLQCERKKWSYGLIWKYLLRCSTTARTTWRCSKMLIVTPFLTGFAQCWYARTQYKCVKISAAHSNHPAVQEKFSKKWGVDDYCA